MWGDGQAEREAFDELGGGALVGFVDPCGVGGEGGAAVEVTQASGHGTEVDARPRSGATGCAGFTTTNGSTSLWG